MRITSLVLSASWFLLLAPAFGQTGSTGISGTVTDASRGVLVGAAIEIGNLDTGLKRTALSDQEGHYVIPQLPPGKYQLSVSFVGFTKYVSNPLSLLVNTAFVQNVTLATLSAVTTSIDVNSEGTPLNTSDATQGHAFDTKPILQYRSMRGTLPVFFRYRQASPLLATTR